MNGSNIVKSYFLEMEDLYQDNELTGIDVTHKIKLYPKAQDAQIAWLYEKFLGWSEKIKGLGFLVVDPSVVNNKQDKNAIFMVTLIAQGGLKNKSYCEITKKIFLNGIKKDIAENILREIPILCDSYQYYVKPNFPIPAIIHVNDFGPDIKKNDFLDNSSTFLEKLNNILRSKNLLLYDIFPRGNSSDEFESTLSTIKTENRYQNNHYYSDAIDQFLSDDLRTIVNNEFKIDFRIDIQ